MGEEKGNRTEWDGRRFLPLVVKRETDSSHATMPFLLDNGLRDTTNQTGGRSVGGPDIRLHTDLGRCAKNMSLRLLHQQHTWEFTDLHTRKYSTLRQKATIIGTNVCFSPIISHSIGEEICLTNRLFLGKCLNMKLSTLGPTVMFKRYKTAGT